MTSDGRMLGTTSRALLGDMADELADTARELQLFEPAPRRMPRFAFRC